MAGRVQGTPTNRSADALAGLQQMVAAVLGPRRPEPGERAMGHGASGAVVAVPEQQPFAADNVWRVTLAGEPFGRLVERARDGAWQLLQLDDLTDAQLDAYEATVSDPPRRALLTTA
jgi:hypothetical protein